MITFISLKSFLTFKFPGSSPIPKPRVICLYNKSCHPGSCLCEIAAATQPSILWGKPEQRAWGWNDHLHYICPKTPNPSFDPETPHLYGGQIICQSHLSQHDQDNAVPLTPKAQGQAEHQTFYFINSLQLTLRPSSKHILRETR